MANFASGPRLRLTAFDLNTKENGPIGIPALNPADGFLIRYDDGTDSRTILLDAGKKGQAERVIVPYLKEHGITRIDAMILSHPHNDHFGGMIDILKEPDITVEQFIYAPVSDETVRISDNDENYRFWLELNALKEKAGSVRPLGAADAGSKLAFGPELLFDIVAVPDDSLMPFGEPANLNDLNLVLRLNFRRFSALFPGDCGNAQAELILRSPYRKLIESVNVLKASHHGGDECASPEFNRLCDASFILITCNEVVVEHRPSFMHNMHEWGKQGAKLLRMDQLRNVEWTTDGRVLECRSESGRYREVSEIDL